MSLILEQFRDKFLISASILTGVWLVYLHSMSPAFPPNDSPETITAAWQLGIQHPPGYPLHSLLGRLAILFWPVGSQAWRVNNFSALLALACCGCLAWIVFEILDRFGVAKVLAFASAWVSAMGLGLSQTFWQQATEAKGGIYLLNLFFLLLLTLEAVKVFFMLAAQSTGGLGQAQRQALRKFFFFWSLLGGLSLANHYLSAAPVLVILFVPFGLAFLRGWLNRRDGFWAFVLLLTGISLYVYMPLRAAFYPDTNLGIPITWKQFCWVFLRQGYSTAQLAQDPHLLSLQIQQWAKDAVSESSIVLLALAAAGLYWVTMKDRWLASLFLGIYLLIFVLVVLVNRTEAGALWLINIFLIPAHAQLCVLAGFSLPLLISFGGPQRFSSKVSGWWIILPLALGFALWGSNRKVCQRQGDFCAYDFGRGILQSLKPGSLYFAEGDFHFMPLYYLRGAEGRRRDATPVLNVLLHFNWSQQDLHRQRPDLSFRNMGDDKAMVTELVQQNLGRVPMASSLYHPDIDGVELKNARFLQHGLVQEVAQAQQKPNLELCEKAFAYRVSNAGFGSLEQLDKNLLPYYTVGWVNQGNDLFANQQYSAAAQAYQCALRLPGEKPESKILFNLGQCWEKLGQWKLASQTYQDSLKLEPDLQASQQGLARVQMREGGAQPVNWLAELQKADGLARQAGQERRAIALYQRAVQQALLPQTTRLAVWQNIGALSAQIGDWQSAENAFAQLSKLDGSNPQWVKMRTFCQEKITQSRK